MKFILSISLIISSIIAFGQQNIKVKEVKNQTIMKFVNSVDSFFRKKPNRFGIMFFVVSNGSGSAQLPESHESSENILISVAEYDEQPQNRVFNAGPFLYLKFVNEIDSGEYFTLTIEHGVANSRKRNRLIIYADKVIIK